MRGFFMWFFYKMGGPAFAKATADKQEQKKSRNKIQEPKKHQ